MALDIFSAGMTGALLGFLLYNFNPAKVFMGDTGSLFLGGCISGMAFALDVPLVLVLLCIMPLIETLSEITGTPVPRPLAGLDKREVRFDQVVEKTEMPSAVLGMLGIG